MIPKPLHNNASIIHYKIKNVIFINWWNLKKKKKKKYLHDPTSIHWSWEVGAPMCTREFQT
jgi:hypothetical protein